MRLKSLFVAGLLCSVWFCGSLHAARHDPSECNGMDWSGFPPSGSTEIDRWCESTQGATSVIANGSTSQIENFCTIEHCDDDCGDDEVSPPSPSTYVCGPATISFAQTKTFTVTGGIEGSAGWLVADLKAKLDIASGQSTTWTGSTSSSVSSQLQYCEWEKYQICMDVITGKKVKVTGTVRPRGKYQFPGYPVFNWAGPTISGTVTGTYALAMDNTIHMGLDSHGTCANGDFE